MIDLEREGPTGSEGKVGKKMNVQRRERGSRTADDYQSWKGKTEREAIPHYSSQRQREERIATERRLIQTLHRIGRLTSLPKRGYHCDLESRNEKD
jgi:hypothetical protein